MTSLSSELTTGDKRTVTVGDVVRLYRDLVDISVPSKGKIQRLGEDSYGLTCEFSTVDCDNLESIQTLKVYSMTIKNAKDGSKFIENVRSISEMHEVHEIASATSKNGRFQARLKQSDDSKKQLLQIWDRSKLLKTIDVSELDVHGTINSDSVFSSFVWCPFGDQDKLLYVCQPKRPKNLSFFKELPPKANVSQDINKPPSSPDPNRGEEFIKRHDWGECLSGIEHTLVAVLDVADNFHITTIDMENYSLASPQWLDNGTKIVSVAYKEDPRRLVLIYTNNKKSNIVVHDWQSTSENLVLLLEDEGYGLHKPRVNNAGDKFLYSKTLLYGADIHSEQLYIYNFRTRANKELAEDKKDRLFIEDIPKNCFTTDDQHVLLLTSDHLYHYMSLLSIESGKISKIKFPTTGVNIMDFRHNIILASGSEVNATPTLFVATLGVNRENDVVAWHQIEDCIHLEEIEYEPYEIPTEDGSSFVSSILVKPDLRVLHQNLRVTNDIVHPIVSNELPTIVMVHGGPYSAYALFYRSYVAFYAKLGLQVLMINYRGSTGVSEKYLQNLYGQVGKVDVEDCLHVIRQFVKDKTIDSSKLIIQGASHGGFISCHLSCQNEFKFTSAIIKNPVVDISTMDVTSETADNCSSTQALGNRSYDHFWYPDKGERAKMYDCSPISRYHKAHVPTLMMLGSKDRLVPMYQGQQWVDLLEARGVKTHCRVYPDKHSLGRVDSTADGNIMAAIWILRHLP